MIALMVLTNDSGLSGCHFEWQARVYADGIAGDRLRSVVCPKQTLYHAGSKKDGRGEDFPLQLKN